MALVRRPFQQVEKLLAAAGRTRLLLGHGNRGAAQVLDPRENAGADAVRDVALGDGAQQHRRDVLAVTADRATAVAEQDRRAEPAGDQLGQRHVGLAGAAGNRGTDEFGCDFQVLDGIDIAARLVQLALAKPVAQMLFGEGAKGGGSIGFQ